MRLTKESLATWQSWRPQHPMSALIAHAEEMLRDGLAEIEDLRQRGDGLAADLAAAVVRAEKAEGEAGQQRVRARIAEADHKEAEAELAAERAANAAKVNAMAWDYAQQVRANDALKAAAEKAEGERDAARAELAAMRAAEDALHGGPGRPGTSKPRTVPFSEVPVGALFECAVTTRYRKASRTRGDCVSDPDEWCHFKEGIQVTLIDQPAAEPKPTGVQCVTPGCRYLCDGVLCTKCGNSQGMRAEPGDAAAEKWNTIDPKPERSDWRERFDAQIGAAQKSKGVMLTHEAGTFQAHAVNFADDVMCALRALRDGIDEALRQGGRS